MASKSCGCNREFTGDRFGADLLRPKRVTIAVCLSHHVRMNCYRSMGATIRNMIGGGSSTAIADEEDFETPDHLFARAWEVPGHAHVVPGALVIVLVGIWYFAGARALGWVVSWAQIERANPVPILLHMFVHENLVHLSLNAAALLLLSAPLIAQLGRPPASWVRYLYLFVGSGVCGAVAFLALNLNHQISMLGSSGAIFGLLGAIARIHPLTGMAVSVRSRRTWLVTKFFVQNHFVLFAVAAIVAVTTGQAPLLAWEAHLGGLLFGFLAAPAFLERP